MHKLLMPKAVSVWLIENTSLTFNQIAQFCNMHELEVKMIADQELGNIVPVSPVETRELTKEEIERCQQDSNAVLKYNEDDEVNKYLDKTLKNSGTTKTKKRKDIPGAVLWLVTTHPKISNYKISKLIGTTSKTIDSIRNKTHKHYSEIVAHNPASVGLCSEEALLEAVKKFQKNSDEE